MDSQRLREMRARLDEAEGKRLSPHACLSGQAMRRHRDPMEESGHRQSFAVDADRVMHSLAYTRYIDKTQVFSLIDNDQITHRVLHVQLVSKIARTIGRLLGLNEDLIEAISLAHDIGHPPFGHDGETFLGEKCLEHGLGWFQHNLQGVHFLERVERGGQGLNLSLQVLDGVLCHDGEAPAEGLVPQRQKTFASLEADIAAKSAQPKLKLRPMTMEGCVVRLADTVAYIGRDLEDAILVGLVQRSDLPAEVREVLGETNGTIVYRLVEDLIGFSAGQEMVGFTPSVRQALAAMKRFNYERIYLHPRIKREHAKIQTGFHRLFEQYLDDLRAERRTSPIYTRFLDAMDDSYRQQVPPAMVVRDFIAALTDQAFIAAYKELVWPDRLPARLDGSPLPPN